jgi:hypothetical protein
MNEQIVLATIAIGWAGWASISIISQGRAVTRILRNCNQHNSDKRQIQYLLNSVNTVNRNLVRIGMHSGMPKADELEVLPEPPLDTEEGEHS